MTITQFRSTEPMYIVVLQGTDATRRLKNWARDHRQQVSVDGNRMRLYEQNSLVTFQMTWSGDWEAVAIWDTWNRRHIHT
jgi:hypothetical protein